MQGKAVNNVVKEVIVARELWAVLRECEDRSDMELEDVSASHVVWQLADVAIAACGRGALAAPKQAEPSKGADLLAWRQRALEAEAALKSAPQAEPPCLQRWKLSDKFRAMQRNEDGHWYAKDEVDSLFAALKSAQPIPATPTPQQISDYLSGLDAVKRKLVEREALKSAQPSAQAQAGAPDAVTLSKHSIAMLMTGFASRSEHTLVAALAAIEQVADGLAAIRADCASQAQAMPVDGGLTELVGRYEAGYLTERGFADAVVKLAAELVASQPSAAAREPLTDAQIEQAAQSVWGAQAKRLPMTAAIQFAREIERAAQAAAKGG